MQPNLLRFPLGPSLRTAKTSAIAVLVGTVLALPSAGEAATTERVSVASDGTQANSDSHTPSISADGRFVAFASTATNLAGAQARPYAYVYVRDRQTGATEFIARGERPAISADGRFVAFESNAADLVPGDSNPIGYEHVFVHDRQTGTNELVDVSSGGTKGEVHAQVPAISANGRYVNFFSASSNLVAGDSNNTQDTFLRDRTAGTTERVSISNGGNELNGASGQGDVSDDGRYVSFVSAATNAVSGDDNNTNDVFLRDRVDGTTQMVSVSSDETPGNGYSNTGSSGTLSGDGRLVFFDSYATNLTGDGRTGIFARDIASGQTSRVLASGSNYTVSSDGRFMSFISYNSDVVAGDTNGTGDAFLLDRQAGTIERVSVSTAGEQANGPSDSPQVSADGRKVVFSSTASNLVPGDTDACTREVRDRYGRVSTVPRNCGDIFVRTLGPQVNNSAEEVAAPGGTVSTNTEVTPSDPVGTSVTSPGGGSVAITESTQTDPAPAGYNILGQQVNIEAPVASADTPLRLVFRLDASILPAGADASTLQVFRNGSPMGDCTGAAGTASPDPCVADRQVLEGGDVALTILTSHASAWNFGLHEAFAFQGPFLSGSPGNTYKAGSAVPVRFSLGGDQGLRVLASGYPRSRPCGSTDAGSPTSGSLKYDSTQAQYVYIWMTSRQWSSSSGGGPCREFLLRLIDGSTHKAEVVFGR